MNKEKLNYIGLIGCCTMNHIIYIFLNIFMTAYFIKLSNYNYTKISLYYVMSFFFIMLCFLIFGKYVKSKSKLRILRLSIIFYALYIFILAILKEKIINYYIILGAIFGICQGLFWVSMHPLSNECTQNKENNFVSTKSIFSKISSIIFPIIFGTSIELTSFSYVSKIIFVVAIIELLFSFLINEKKEVRTYDLKKYKNYVKSKKSFKYYYKLVAISGIISEFLDTIITILIILNFKTLFNLGFLTTVFSLVSVLSIIILQKIFNNKKEILKIGAILMSISLILLLVDINKVTIIIYNLLNNMFLVTLLNNGTIKRYEIINKSNNIIKNYLI